MKQYRNRFPFAAVFAASLAITQLAGATPQIEPGSVELSQRGERKRVAEGRVAQ